MSRLVAGSSSAAAAVTLLATALSGSLAFAQNPSWQSGFPTEVPGTRVQGGSVALGDVDGDGVDDIVVGTIDGKVHALRGNGTWLWSYDTGDMAIESKAAIADVDGDGAAEVVIGAGSTLTVSSHGGLYVISHLGGLQCQFQTNVGATGWRAGVFSSPAVADLDGNDGGRLEIAFGAWDRYVRVIHHNCAVLWIKDVLDTVWSSPAIGDLDGNGQLDVVIGVDSDHIPGPNGEEDGGILHAYNGLNGAELAGFPIQVDEVIWSSPGLGDLDGDGRLEIVVGTGYCWANPDCAPRGDFHPGVGEYISAWNHDGTTLSGWPVPLPGTYAFASPALADLDGDGLMEVVVNTIDAGDNQAGMVYALDGNGSNLPGWPVQPITPSGVGTTVSFSTRASPIVADLVGDARPEIVLPSNWELVVWAADGTQLSRDSFPPPADALVLSTSYTISGAAAAGDVDGDGDIDVVAGGAATGGAVGVLYAWDFAKSAGGEQPWPMFRRSSENTAQATQGLIFADGFESGGTGAWTATAP